MQTLGLILKTQDQFLLFRGVKIKVPTSISKQIWICTGSLWIEDLYFVLHSPAQYYM